MDRGIFCTQLSDFLCLIRDRSSLHDQFASEIRASSSRIAADRQRMGASVSKLGLVFDRTCSQLGNRPFVDDSCAQPQTPDCRANVELNRRLLGDGQPTALHSSDISVSDETQLATVSNGRPADYVQRSDKPQFLWYRWTKEEWEAMNLMCIVTPYSS